MIGDAVGAIIIEALISAGITATAHILLIGAVVGGIASYFGCEKISEKIDHINFEHKVYDKYQKPISNVYI